MQQTRWEILQILKRNPGATVDELAKTLGMTPMGVRLHLVVLERDDLVRRATERNRPGRPTLHYYLTDLAEDRFPKHYDVLADALLASIKEDLSPEVTRVLCAHASRQLIERFRHKVVGRSLEERVQALARALTESGGFAQCERVDGNLLFHDYNCPYHRVAMRHAEVCDIDRQFLEDLLGARVERTASFVENGRRCTYRISPREETLATDAG